MCRDLRTSIYLDDSTSINSVPVENRPHTNIFAGYFHDVSDLFQKRQLRMSKVICDLTDGISFQIILACSALAAILGHYAA